MAESTTFAISFQTMIGQLGKAHERYIQHLDSNQYELAGVELGRMAQIGEHFGAMASHACDALWRDSQAAKQRSGK